MGLHVESEDHKWQIDIPDHAGRTETTEFRNAKALVKQILASLTTSFYGADQIQEHHGGSLWLYDATGWFIVKNMAGLEWSSQFCADPAKVELLRLNAVRLYAGFPLTIPAMAKLGYKDTSILTTPIVTADDIGHWVDSIFNSCVPLPAVHHTAVLPTGGGVHHYPTPITDIDLFKQDSFVLWVTDPASQHQVAVVPTGPPNSGVKTVQLVYAPIGTALHAKHIRATVKNKPVILGASNPLAKQAFAQQKDT